MTIKEAARLWNITERRVNELCLTGRIQGAIKNGRSWTIPDSTIKPRDDRYKKTAVKYEINAANPVMLKNEDLAVYKIYRTYSKKPKALPIGVSDYKTIVTKYYYIDKTFLIKDLIDSGSYISLFTRPRRFGKTLNMDMLRVFFEKTEEDNSIYFKDKDIWQYGAEYTNEQGQYPVIWLSFKDIKDSGCTECLAHIKHIVCGEYIRHGIEIPDEPLTGLIRTLSQILYSAYKRKVIILIDEYDTPFQTAHAKGYYDEIIDTVRMMLSSCLKDNPFLERGILTGILEISKESIFSDLNNVRSFTVLSENFSSGFGFTEDEVLRLIQTFGNTDKITEIKEWYNGYRFGSVSIYNPWSVLMYLSEDCKPAPYWRNTGSNQILGEMIDYMDPNLKSKLICLMQNQSITSVVDTKLAYSDLKKNPYAVFSLLVASGYIKINEFEMENGHIFGKLSLPNKELSCIFKEEILNRFADIIPQEYEISFIDAIKSYNADLLEEKLKAFLLDTVSYHDAAEESFYHGLLLGLCAQLGDYYFINSNKESGYGRYDIQLKPKKKNVPGVIIELKSIKEKSGLKKAASDAVNQISEKEYFREMQGLGIDKILSYGVAFCGKNVVVKVL